MRVVDELRLSGYPAVVGRGLGWSRRGAPADLELLACRAFRSGITLQQHRVR